MSCSLVYFRMISLECLIDGKVKAISRDAASLSGMLRSALADEAHPIEETIIIKNTITSETLARVIDYLERRKAQNEVRDGSLVESSHPTELTRPIIRPPCNDPLDLELTSKLCLNEAIKLMKAADYLDVPSLVQLSGQRIAAIFNSMTISELMALQGLTELTPGWAEKVRKENQWCGTIQPRGG